MSQINVMEAIWQASTKAEDGNLYYPETFIAFLWENGFVDTAKYSKVVWKAAFDPFKQPDGIYRLTHNEFLILEKYRYTGEIHIPFDAARINEGKYTDEGFQKLVDASIAPSSCLPPDQLKKFVDELKNEFRQADDLLLVKAPTKTKIKKMLEENPSPLRKLELLFDDMLRSKSAQKEVEALRRQTAVPTATPEQLAALQQSQFLTGAASLAEAQSQKLREMAKTLPTKETGGPARLPDGQAEGEPLKKIKRSKKGVRG